MNLRTATLITATTLTLGLGAVNYLTPQTIEESTRNRQQQPIDDLSDAHENTTGGQRDAGEDHLKAELGQRNIPVQPTPPITEPKPKATPAKPGQPAATKAKAPRVFLP